MATSKLLISREEIAKKIDELAGTIAADYEGSHPLIVGVLNGSYIFMADLTRALWGKGFGDFDVEFIGVTSYGDGKESSRNPQLTKDLKADIKDRHVLIVEDVIDTGWTLDFIDKLFKSRNPKVLKTVTLLSKPSKKEVDYTPDYIGFEVDGGKWVEGYGLDGGKSGRGCPDVREVIS